MKCHIIIIIIIVIVIIIIIIIICIFVFIFIFITIGILTNMIASIEEDWTGMRLNSGSNSNKTEKTVGWQHHV